MSIINIIDEILSAWSYNFVIFRWYWCAILLGICLYMFLSVSNVDNKKICFHVVVYMSKRHPILISFSKYLFVFYYPISVSIIVRLCAHSSYNSSSFNLKLILSLLLERIEDCLVSSPLPSNFRSAKDATDLFEIT